MRTTPKGKARPTDVYPEKRVEEKAPVTEYVLKFVLMGQASSGKTHLLRRFIANGNIYQYLYSLGGEPKNTDGEAHAVEEPYPTGGLEVSTRGLPFQETCTVQAQIWDCSGKERPATVYFKNAVGALLVYDITDRTSFEHVPKLVTEIQQNCHVGVALVLVGNKCDKEELRVITKLEAQAMAAQYGMDFIEVSAVNNVNVEVAFRRLIMSIATLLPAPQLIKERLPSGWTEVKDQYHTEYENFWTGERVQTRPIDVASQQNYGEPGKRRKESSEGMLFRCFEDIGYPICGQCIVS